MNVDSIKIKFIHVLSYCFNVGIFYFSVHRLKSTMLIPMFIEMKRHPLNFDSKLFRTGTSIFMVFVYSLLLYK